MGDVSIFAVRAARPAKWRILIVGQFPICRLHAQVDNLLAGEFGALGEISLVRQAR
jgi:hypothetical protein